MKNKTSNKLYFITLVLIILTTCLLSFLYTSEQNLKKNINVQINILKSPIVFLNKIQFFYDRALMEYIQHNNKKAIFNLEISKSFISIYNIQKNKNFKNIMKIINKTEENIKNNKKFDLLKYQKNLYIFISNVNHNYYSKTHDLIKSLENILNKNKFNIIIMQLLIILISVLIILSLFFYKLKKIFKNNAYTDHLTNSFNRRYFFEKVKKLPKGTHSLIMFDIDYFKKINDTYGHNVGDDILKQTVELIKNHIRKDDLIFRWGGEEFIILLENVNKNKAFEIAENLRKLIQSHNFNGIKITASFGVKEIKNKISANDLKTLDNALYLSKQKGRNQVNVLD